MTDQMPPPVAGGYVWTSEGYKWVPASEESAPPDSPPPPPPALVPAGDGYTWRPAGSPPAPMSPD